MKRLNNVIRITLQHIKDTWIVWCLFVISLYVAISCEFNQLCVISVPFKEDTIISINKLLEGGSLSYIAGFIVYLLTEFGPFIKRKCFVFSKSILLLNDICEVFKTINYRLQDSDWLDNNSSPNDAFYNLTGYEYDPQSTPICIISSDIINMMKKTVYTIDMKLETLLSFDVYLGDTIYKQMIEINNSKCITMMRRDSFFEHLSYEADELMFFLKDLIETYRSVNSVCNMIKTLYK